MPAPAKISVTPFGDARRLVLPNGVSVVYQRTTRLPVVAIAAAVDAGAAADPPRRPGLSTMTVELLRTGTTTLDEEGLALAFADLGGGLRADRGQDWIDVSTQLLAEDFERGLGLVADVLRRPAFIPEKLERTRRELLAEKRSSLARAEDILIEAFYEVAYEGHPYSTPVNGTERSLGEIGPEDVRLFHAKYFVPQSTTLAIVGDVDEGRLGDAVEKAFGDWAAAEPGAELRTKSDRTKPSPRPGLFFVHKDGQTQAHVRIGHPLVPRSHRDFDRLLVGNYVLGGAGLASRIADNVRTRNGLAYSAGSFIVPRRLDGPFVASAQTKSESCARAVSLMREEIERLRAEPVSQAELETAQAQYAGSLPFRLETNAHKAGALLEAALFELGPNHLARQVDAIRGLGQDEVRDAAERWLAPGTATIVVVGERGAVMPQLETLGAVQEVSNEQ